jgi:MYXO-CTERM domain-containing protein
MKTAAIVLAACAGLAAAQSYSGDTLLAADGSWDRPVGAGPAISGLGPVDFDVQAFFVDASGDYAINSVQDYDGYIHLYVGAFDPADQLNGLVDGNDDGAGGIGTSDIDVASLVAGTQYFIVTSGFAAGDAGAFTNSVRGQGTATFGLIPTPGAAAVLGLAGLAATRRRR